jgi:hypothetical protein
MLSMRGTIRGGGAIFFFSAPLFKIFICVRLRCGVNNRCGILRDRFLGRYVRATRLWNYFQGAAEFVDFFVD